MSKKIGHYFLKEKELNFIKSGCLILDLVLGGGWPLGRISNVVGDKSTGKTLLAIEACANFANQYPKGTIYYLEAEAAFDKGYAKMLGMPEEGQKGKTKVCFVDDINTVEGLFKNLFNLCEKKTEDPVLYIVDSLDALDASEKSFEDLHEKGYSGARKAGDMSIMFRKLAKKIKKRNIHLMFISQIRTRIGVTFGKTTTRSGGKAMDFYASQVLWLYELGKRVKTIKSITRPYALDIKARCEKNKVSLPYRECRFDIYIMYGSDNFGASLNWLKEVSGLDGLGIGGGYSYKDICEVLDKSQLENLSKKELSLENPESKTRLELRQLLCEKWELKKGGRRKSPGGIFEAAERLREKGNIELKKKIEERVTKLWNELEVDFLPKNQKYSN